METVLLVDDDILFKAVEGTCLRREKCRLIMTPPEELLRAALSEKPGLIVASLTSDTPQAELVRLLESKSLGTIPIIVLELGPGPVDGPARAAIEKRQGVCECLVVPDDPSGGLDLPGFDALLDERIQSAMSWSRRGGDRVAISLPVKCRGERFQGTLRTKNISPSGLFLKTDRFLDLGSLFDVRFTLPVSVLAGEETDAPSDSIRPIPVIARCKVVRRVGASGQSDQDLIPGLGVRFVDLGNEGRLALNRVAGRVRSSGGHPARATG